MSCCDEHCNCSEGHKVSGGTEHRHAGLGHRDTCCGGEGVSAVAAQPGIPARSAPTAVGVNATGSRKSFEDYPDAHLG